MRSTDLLIQEHKLILRTLDVLDSLTTSVDAGAPLDRGDVDKVLDFLRWFADAHHQVKEETILFPAIRAQAAAADPPVKHMMFEHDQDRQLIENLEKDVRSGRVTAFSSCVNRLSSTLRNHIYKEDALLFPDADALLDERQDAEIFERLNRFDTALDRQILEQKLSELHALEWKYLRK